MASKLKVFANPRPKKSLYNMPGQDPPSGKFLPGWGPNGRLPQPPEKPYGRDNLGGKLFDQNPGYFLPGYGPNGRLPEKPYDPTNGGVVHFNRNGSSNPASTARTRLGIKDPVTGKALGAELDDLLRGQNERAREMAEILLGIRDRAARGDHELAMDAWGKQSAWSERQGDKDRAVQLAGINASQQAVIDDRAMKANQFAEQLRDQRNNDAFSKKMMEQSMDAQRLADTNAFWERAGIRARESLAERNRMDFQRQEGNKDRQLEQSRMQLQDGQNMRQLAIQSEANQRAAQEAAEQRLSNERLAMNSAYLTQQEQAWASASSRRANLLNFVMSGLRYS